MKTSDIFLKFIDESTESGVLYVSISDILQVGNPIDENGDDMVQVDDRVYVLLSDGTYSDVIRK